MRILQVCGRLFLALWLALAPVKALAGSMTLLGAGSVGTAPSYQGPGDVVSGWAYWFSTARVLTAAQASSSTSLADLVDSAAPTTTICTLRATSSGAVDLVGTYCTGGLTPAAKCAAATGGKCNISKLYDLSGNARDATQTTAANQPSLTFSALNGLPAITCTAASATLMSIAVTVTSSQPYFASAVYIRSSGTAEGAILSFNTGTSFYLEAASGANLVGANNEPAAVQTAAATDAAYHAVNVIYNGASSSINVDGSSSSVTLGTTGLSSNTFRICRGPGGAPPTLQGNILEVGLGLGSGNSSGLNTNQHGTNGYNF